MYSMIRRNRVADPGFSGSVQRILIGLFLVATLSPAGAAVYKYTDRYGVTTYSETRPHDRTYRKFHRSCLDTYLGCGVLHPYWRAPRLNLHSYQSLISKAAARHGIDAALIRAVIHAESAFNPTAVSRAGAQGLMQLMPATQHKFGVRDPFNVWENVEAGTRLLKILLQKYRYNIRLATAAYNAGETAVARYRGIPPYEETQNYVQRVTRLYARYKQAN